ncbi:unnamed protein product, partial [Ixodes hexagonus]
MKEPRRGHSRRCRSAECNSEHAGDEHAFKNPLSKWYRHRKRHKDDEAQLLDPDYEGSHENSQGLRGSGQGKVCKGSSSATEAIHPQPRPQQKQQKPRTEAEQEPLVEDLSTRTRIRPALEKQTLPVAPVVPAVPTKPVSCQSPQDSGRSRPMCPAERARLAFPGCRDKSPGAADAAPEPQRLSGVQSLDSVLGQLCPGGKCRLSMKIKDPQDPVQAPKNGGDESSCTITDVAQQQCSLSNFPTSFPASIEVLMTVNHSCGMHKTLSEKSLHHDTSTISVVQTKPGHRQEIISIPKSRFIMVSTLLSFVILACFAVTIYSFSVPPGESM